MPTKEQFLQYRKVQFSGRYNMLGEARAAAKAAGLTLEEYKNVIVNYEECVELYLKKEVK